MTTSAVRGPVPAPGSLPDRPSALGRIGSIIRHPTVTFRAVLADPRWAGVLALAAVASGMAGAILGQTETGRMALVDQWERTANGFGWNLTDDQYSRLWELSRHGALYAGVSAVLGGALLSCAIALGVWAVLKPGAGLRPSLQRVLAVGAHAGVILALREVIAAPISFVRESTVNAMTIGAWLPGLDAGSPLAHVFGFLDVFVIWWVVVLAIGFGLLYQRSPRRLAAAFVGVYVVLALGMATAMAVMNPVS